MVEYEKDPTTRVLPVSVASCQLAQHHRSGGDEHPRRWVIAEANGARALLCDVVKLRI